MSKGEFNSVAQVNGGIENMINWDGKDKDTLALIIPFCFLQRIIILIIQKAGQRRKEKSLQLQEYKIRLYDSIF